MDMEKELLNAQCECGTVHADMNAYLNYFENYYEKYYDATSFYSDDNIFQCRFPDEINDGKTFTIKLLSVDAYNKMQQHGILDKYLEILKVRDSSCSRDISIRCCSWDYMFKIEKCLVDKMDEILPYINDQWKDTIIKLSDFSVIYMTKKKNGYLEVTIMDGDTYTPGQIGTFVTKYSVGEIEEAELKLNER